MHTCVVLHLNTYQTLDAARMKQQAVESVAEQVCTSFMREAVDECIVEVFQVRFLI